MTCEPSASFQIPEPYYMALFEAMPGNNVLVQNDAPKFTILAATPGYLRQTGYTKEAMIGKGVFEAFPVNTDPNNTGGRDLLSSYNHVVLHKEPHFLPVQRYDLQNDDGNFSERYWKVENRPVFAPDGEVIYIIHSTEDITAQIKAKERENQIEGIEKAFGLFMHAPIVVGLVNGDDYVLEMANEEAFKLWGKGAKMIGKPILQVLPELEGQGIKELFDQVRTSGKPYLASEVPVTSYTAGKEERHFFNLVYQPYFTEGSAKATGVFTISYDVTEQVLARKAVQESEAKYRSLFNSMDQGFCIIEIIFTNNEPVDYRFLEINPVFEKQTGLKNAVGKTARELVPDLEQSWFDLYGKVAVTGEAIRFVEGSEAMSRWFEVYAFKLGGEESRKVALLFTDITKRKKAEEAIKQSESNLRNTILQAPVAMAILRGSSFVVEIANEHMYELWGRGPEDLLNKSIFEGLPEVKDQGYEELLTGVFTTGERFTAQGIPVTLPRSGGIETLYINLLYEAYREADGTISGVIAVATNVTELVLAKKKVEESHKELQFVMDVMPQMVWLTKPDGYHYLYNKQWYDYTGLTYGETEGEGWNGVFHPDDQQRAWNVWRHSLETGEPYEIEYRCRRYDGAYRWFLGRALALKDASGNILKWFGTCTDIDDQKKAAALMEQQVKERTQELENKNSLLDNILKNSSNGISVSEAVRNERGEVVDMTTMLANEAAVKFTGLPREVYLNERATMIVPDLFSSPYGKGCISTLETGEPFVMQYHLIQTGRWLEVTTSKMDADHLIHIFTDVTPIKEAQLQLERTIEDLKRSNKNLEEFAYAASHDLKEPIRKIHFFADRLKQGLADKLSEEQKRLFSRMEHAAERMTVLIDDLLTYSHISRDTSHLESVDLNKKMQSVLEDLELEIEEKKAKIIIDHLPTITGHRRQIQQLFQNLISNALKYSRPDLPPQIYISSQVASGDDMHKQYYLIEVKDNGIGFDQKDAERIFNVFTRLHGNAEYRGTGVGLSIAQKVAENHGGKIWAESKQGEGSTFKVLLPAE